VNSSHLVDPELRAVLEQFPPGDFSAETLPLVRALNLEMPPDPEGGVLCSEQYVPGPAGAPPVRMLIYRPDAPAAAPLPGVLHMHGGGYVFGKPESTDGSSRALVRNVGCVVVSVDYRLAPETTYPGAIEDCYAALQWLHREASALGVDARRLAVAGESAGGGLAAALALLARDRGEVPLCFQQLIFPMIDDRTGSAGDVHPYTGKFIWTAASNRFGWTSLLGREPGDDVSPYAAAARAADLAGLPPAFIAVGALDLFLEENIKYARRLMRAGVPTELHVYPGAFHAFQLAPDAYVTRQANRDAKAAFTRGLAPKPDCNVPESR